MNESPPRNPPTLLRSAVESTASSKAARPAAPGRRVTPLDLSIMLTAAVAIGTALLLVTR